MALLAEENETIRAQGPIPSQRTERNRQRRRQRSVFQYIAILFAAALVLLFYTYMMEQRQYEQLQRENQDNIQQSVSATQTLQGLIDENQQLKGRTEELEKQLQALEDQLAAAQQGQAGLQAQLQDAEKTSQAMDWFWQIDEAYVRGRYSLCRELIQSLEGAGLADYLPAESVTDNGRFSPAGRYQEIRDKVIK